jgi:hypothetical protein
VVCFPSERVEPGNSRPIRALLRSAVLSFSSYLTGEVFDSSYESLPQSIDPGDANPDVATNRMQVFSSTEDLRVLSSLQVSPQAFSPNGDGINDQTRIPFLLLGVQESDVKVQIFDTNGRKVRTLASGTWGQKAYETS